MKRLLIPASKLATGNLLFATFCRGREFAGELGCFTGKRSFEARGKKKVPDLVYDEKKSADKREANKLALTE